MAKADGAVRFIADKNQDFSQWYVDVVVKAELADYAPVGGCMVIRPYGYALWENMVAVLDRMFKDTGHENYYFPALIPMSFLQREAEHVEGFAPECAVVTHGGGKKLEEPLVFRPTSETIIWSTYAKWINSYRDLPLLYNQWANIVRWEMRTRLFLRTTEFLWQEGHTAHATAEEAEEEAQRMLEVYRSFVEDWMALPVLCGRKTDLERFAGAVRTYTIEAMMGDKRALQGGTSHFLGQNFAKAFDVKFQNEKGELEYVWGTSWGVSTRLIGALVMGHGDERGLVMPPKLAPIQVVIVPIYHGDEERARVLEVSGQILTLLKKCHRVKLDDRDQLKPGWKFNEWEMRGVPLRLEVGPRDIAKRQVICVRRDTLDKKPIALDRLEAELDQLLQSVQQGIFDKALAFQRANSYVLDDYSAFREQMAEGGFIRARWCGSQACELGVKEDTAATIRLIPFDAEADPGPCIKCGGPAESRVVFAKAY